MGSVEVGGGVRDISIRESSEGDIRYLWEICRNQTFEEFRRWGADLVYDYPADLRQMERRVKACEGMKLLAIERSGDVIGFAEIDGLKEGEESGVLARLILKEDSRGRGYGAQAVERILDYAADVLGLGAVKLVVYADNAGARKCYEKCGFACTGELLREGRPGAWEMETHLPHPT